MMLSKRISAKADRRPKWGPSPRPSSEEETLQGLISQWCSFVTLTVSCELLLQRLRSIGIDGSRCTSKCDSAVLANEAPCKLHTRDPLSAFLCAPSELYARPATCSPIVPRRSLAVSVSRTRRWGSDPPLAFMYWPETGCNVDRVIIVQEVYMPDDSLCPLHCTVASPFNVSTSIPLQKDCDDLSTALCKTHIPASIHSSELSLRIHDSATIVRQKGPPWLLKSVRKKSRSRKDMSVSICTNTVNLHRHG